MGRRIRLIKYKMAEAQLIIDTNSAISKVLIALPPPASTAMVITLIKTRDEEQERRRWEYIRNADGPSKDEKIIPNVSFSDIRTKQD